MHTIIDSICHIDDSSFDADRKEVIENSHKLGVDKIVVPSISALNWKIITDICAEYECLYPAIGLHPQFVNEHEKDDIDKLDQYLDHHPCVAVGEVGLDYYEEDADRDRQQWFFQHQLEVAMKHDMPLIMHVRKAHPDVIACLKKTAFKRGGTVHAFNGSIEIGEEYIKLGFKLGFGGMLTNPNASKLQKLAAQLPLSAIVLESDAPDLSSINHKGERNSPEYLPEVLQKLADIRPETIETIAQQTTVNTNDVLGLNNT